MTLAGRRIALLLTTPGWRGSAVSFLKIAAGLRRHGHDVLVIAGETDVAARFERESGLPVALVPTGDTGRREVRTVRRLLRDMRVEVVIADSPRDVRIARYASLGSRRRIAWRYNLSSRDVPPDPLQRFLFGGVDAIVQQSDFGAGRIATGMPWCRTSGRQVTIANGYDTALLAPDPHAGRIFRAQLGVPADHPLVLTAGSLVANKRAGVLPAALAGLGATWIVAGDGPERAAIADQAAALGVHAVIGELPARGLRDAMRAADLVVQPSAAEIFPNVVAEAMAIGCAVIGAASGAAPEVIANAGMVVPVDQPELLRESVAALLRNPDRRRLLGEAARARIMATFPLAAMEDGYDQLVRSVTL